MVYLNKLLTADKWDWVVFMQFLSPISPIKLCTGLAIYHVPFYCKWWKAGLGLEAVNSILPSVLFYTVHRSEFLMTQWKGFSRSYFSFMMSLHLRPNIPILCCLLAVNIFYESKFLMAYYKTVFLLLFTMSLIRTTFNWGHSTPFSFIISDTNTSGHCSYNSLT